LGWEAHAIMINSTIFFNEVGLQQLLAATVLIKAEEIKWFQMEGASGEAWLLFVSCFKGKEGEMFFLGCQCINEQYRKSQISKWLWEVEIVMWKCNSSQSSTIAEWNIFPSAIFILLMLIEDYCYIVVLAIWSITVARIMSSEWEGFTFLANYWK
jgi:hypothetical protein